MTGTLAENRKSIAIGENDVALIFKENGHVDLSFPEMTGEHVPEHVMAALVLSYAVVDEDFFALIQDHFSQQVSVDLEREFECSSSSGAEEVDQGSANPITPPYKPAMPPPHLKVVS